jgi:hypothetical protein
MLKYWKNRSSRSYVTPRTIHVIPQNIAVVKKLLFVIDISCLNRFQTCETNSRDGGEVHEKGNND